MKGRIGYRHFWTDEEIQVLTEMFEAGATDSAISKVLKLDSSTVMRKRLALGLRNDVSNTPYSWTEKEERLAVEMRERGAPIMVIAKRLERFSPDVVKRKLSALLTKPPTVLDPCETHDSLTAALMGDPKPSRRVGRRKASERRSPVDIRHFDRIVEQRYVDGHETRANLPIPGEGT